MKIYRITLAFLLFIIIGGVIFMMLDMIWNFISVELNNKIGQTLFTISVMFIMLFIFYPEDNNY